MTTKINEIVRRFIAIHKSLGIHDIIEQSQTKLFVVAHLILKKGITPLTAIGEVCQYPLVVYDADFIDNPTLADGGKQRAAIGRIVLFEQIRL